MDRFCLHAATLAAIFVPVVATVDARAATRTELDRGNELRLALEGRVFTATIVDLPRVVRHPTIQSEVVGKRLRVACGTSFQPRRRDLVTRTARWPRGAGAVSVSFQRDVSRDVKWCLVEADEGEFRGGDIAFVSFREAEVGRGLASGQFPDGRRWRIAAWRGERLEPCVSLRARFGSLGSCFLDLAEVDRGIEGAGFVDPCSRGMVIIGAVERKAARVALRVAGGTVVDAELRHRPRGSRARAQYFLATFAEPVDVELAIAYDVKGRILARDDGIGGGGPSSCPSKGLIR